MELMPSTLVYDTGLYRGLYRIDWQRRKLIKWKRMSRPCLPKSRKMSQSCLSESVDRGCYGYVCLKHDKCPSLACLSRLTRTSTNWVGKDVTVMHIQSVLSIATWQISRSYISRTCSPSLYVRSKPHLHAFILNRSITFHIGLV